MAPRRVSGTQRGLAGHNKNQKRTNLLRRSHDSHQIKTRINRISTRSNGKTLGLGGELDVRSGGGVRERCADKLRARRTVSDTHRLPKKLQGDGCRGAEQLHYLEILRR